jgi:hypothetical protein
MTAPNTTQTGQKHTPEPWRVEKYVGEYRIRRPSPNGMPTELTMRLAALEVARVPADHSNPNDDGHSNARLIAAAPQLLENVKRLRELVCALSVRHVGSLHVDDQDEIANCDRLARAAIAKATKP